MSLVNVLYCLALIIEVYGSANTEDALKKEIRISSHILIEYCRGYDYRIYN